MNNNNNKRRVQRTEKDKRRNIFRGYCSMNSNLVFKSMTRAFSHSSSSSSSFFNFSFFARRLLVGLGWFASHSIKKKKKTTTDEKVEWFTPCTVFTYGCECDTDTDADTAIHLFTSHKLRERVKKSNRIRKIQIFCFYRRCFYLDRVCEQCFLSIIISIFSFHKRI